MLDILVAVLAITCLCLFLKNQFKISSGFTPLVALSTTALWFSVVGMLGILWAGGLVWYIVCGVLGVFTLGKHSIKSSLANMLSPAFLLFLLGSILVCIYLGIRQPVLHEWDEYSLWGTIVKIMKENNELYTTAPSGFAWASTQTPTLPAISYFVQFFGKYAEWKIYTAYSILYLSVISALMATVPLRKYQVAVPLGIVGLLTPWFMTVYNREYEAKLVWLSSYGDIPAGMVFAGVLVLYFGLRTKKQPLWPVIPVLAALALIKDNTFVFALAAAGIMVLDLLLDWRKKKDEKSSLPRVSPTKKIAILGNSAQYTWIGRIIYMVLFLLSAIAPYMLWTNCYIAGVVAARKSAGITDPNSLSPFSALLAGTKMLFGLEEKSTRFTEVWQEMWKSFLWNTTNGNKRIGGAPLSMLGGGLMIVFVITVLFVFAIILLKNKKVRVRIGVAYGAMLLCFIGYTYEIFISYVFIFGDGQGLTPSYNRYMYGYYIGWFLLAVYFLAQAALQTLNPQEKPIYAIKTFVAQGAIFAFAGVMMLRTSMLLPLYNSDIGYTQDTFSSQKIEQNYADVLNQTMNSGAQTERIFYVNQTDNGEEWFLYHYLLLPNILDYSGIATKAGGPGGGGGTYTAPELLNGEPATNYNTYAPLELQEYMTDAGITYVFLDEIDDRFVDSYASLFTDGLQQAKNGATVLYKVNGAGSSLMLSPVEMEVAVR